MRTIGVVHGFGWSRGLLSLVFLLASLLVPCRTTAQSGVEITGTVMDIKGVALAEVTVRERQYNLLTKTDESGAFVVSCPAGLDTLNLEFSSIGFVQKSERIAIDDLATRAGLVVVMEPAEEQLNEVVVSGTLRPVSRAQSPVPVEVYSAAFLRANPAPNLFESLQTVNGLRPQLNCSVCNTGDIHVNGLEGPYTMVLIDGMPIVSGLSTVYGLMGIPQSMIERLEVVKGPASTLYGSEAIGGLINVITKHPSDADRLTADVRLSSWGEVNADVGLKTLLSDKTTSLLGMNYFRYATPTDHNADNFTDLTLQDRISVFNTWSVRRAEGRALRLAARYLYEDRWGGELSFRPRQHRGGSEVYGESIYTNRWECIGTYDLPVPAAIRLQYSLSGHYQNSTYGNTVFQARQVISFGQLTYSRAWTDTHELLLGAAYRYTAYDDSTVATSTEAENAPARISLPGLFVQDQVKLHRNVDLLAGLRYDLDSRHGSILTPRLNLKYGDAEGTHSVRLGVGNGYRVANVFTEDHAALTGARTTVFAEALLPETSWNVNLNYLGKAYDWSPGILTLDASLWYTYFTNRIIPDYETDPNQIIYANLDGYAVSRGGSLNLDILSTSGAVLRLGVTWQDVYTSEDGERRQQLLTESFSGVWNISLPFRRDWQLDYTGNVYGPMPLPLLGPLDPRPGESPWFSIQNLQVRRTLGRTTLYGGIKNLLNFTPPANSIARPFDPFDREVTFAADGSVVPTPDNPHALTFDPTYVFAANQGIRVFFGLSYRIR